MTMQLRKPLQLFVACFGHLIQLSEINLESWKQVELPNYELYYDIFKASTRFAYLEHLKSIFKMTHSKHEPNLNEAAFIHWTIFALKS